MMMEKVIFRPRPYTLFSYKEPFIRNVELEFIVKYNGFFCLLFPVTMKNNMNLRKFKY